MLEQNGGQGLAAFGHRHRLDHLLLGDRAHAHQGCALGQPHLVELDVLGAFGPDLA